MTELRPALDRGHANHGWLDSYHSFSFGGYHDPKHMGYGPLRVINEDRVQAGKGFGKHGHRDMEIISYVLEGALGHEDSMGNASTIVPGDVQRMSAGTGIQHAEFNHSESGVTHFLQIWIEPGIRNIKPSYEQKQFSDHEKRGSLRLVVSPDGRQGSLHMTQNAFMYAGLFDGVERAELLLAPQRKGYVHIARGELRVNSQQLRAGDALKIDSGPITLTDGHGSEVLVFDLPDA